MKPCSFLCGGLSCALFHLLFPICFCDAENWARPCVPAIASAPFPSKCFLYLDTDVTLPLLWVPFSSWSQIFSWKRLWSLSRLLAGVRRAVRRENGSEKLTFIPFKVPFPSHFCFACFYSQGRKGQSCVFSHKGTPVYFRTTVLHRRY